MAFSIALITLLGLLSDYLLKKIKLPGLLGMLIIGILSGPHVFNIIQPELLRVSSDFRMIALVVILLRAGLKIQKETIIKVGKTAMLMSFIPSTFEGIAILFMAPFLFDVTYPEAGLLGFIVAAVSPAVVIPSMIKFMGKGLGTTKGIPSMILASSSIDNAYVIVVFSTLLGIVSGSGPDPFIKLLDIPVSIITGIAVGLLLGYILYRLFDRYSLRATKMTIVLMAVSVLLIWLEQILKTTIAMSPLLGVMTIGFILLEKTEIRAHKISQKLSKLWIFAEILLFVLVGAQVDINVAWNAGLAGAALIFIALIARSIGTYVSLMGTDLNLKEKVFCIISYIPKATVQAAIGAIPLEAGIKGGDMILAVAVLSILLTAPIGAIGIMVSGERWLEKEK